MAGLTYQGMTANQGSSSSGSSSGGNSWYNSLFGSLGGILTGAGSLVRDIKTDYNQVARDQAAAAAATAWYNPASWMQGTNPQQRNNTIIWVVLGVVLLVAMFFMFRK